MKKLESLTIAELKQVFGGGAQEAGKDGTVAPPPPPPQPKCTWFSFKVTVETKAPETK